MSRERGTHRPRVRRPDAHRGTPRESPYGEDYSHSDARWAVAHVHANWNAEAVGAAKSYLRSGHFSRRSLIEQLESPYGSQFTHARAVYGVSKAYR